MQKPIDDSMGRWSSASSAWKPKATNHISWRAGKSDCAHWEVVTTIAPLRTNSCPALVVNST